MYLYAYIYIYKYTYIHVSFEVKLNHLEGIVLDDFRTFVQT